MKDSQNMKKGIVNGLSEREKIVLETLIYLRGLVLRKQLLKILEVIYDLDEMAASIAISKLIEKKLFESKTAMVGCNAVMIRLTRKGKALIENKTAKEVSSITDTHANNLRCIFKIETLIMVLEGMKTEQRMQKTFESFKHSTLFKSKNDYMSLYKTCKRLTGDVFKTPDLGSPNSDHDDFNFFNMMSSEFYLSNISVADKKIKVTVFFYGVYELNSGFKIIKYQERVKFIYDMFKNCLYREWKGDMNLELHIKANLFDYNECKYFNKKINRDFITKVSELYSDTIQIDAIDVMLDKKYKLRRPLK